MIQVVNQRLHQATKNDLYIGRPSPLGNPWSHRKSNLKDTIQVANAQIAVANYRQWLYESIRSKKAGVIAELSKITPDTNLVCWCVPYNVCHGEVIKQIFDKGTILIKCEESGVPEYDQSPNCYFCKGTGWTEDDISDYLPLFKKW